MFVEGHGYIAQSCHRSGVNRLILKSIYSVSGIEIDSVVLVFCKKMCVFVVFSIFIHNLLMNKS